jgi:NAD(P)-dependent dehydrogenase (short-subunit alcohol dehydrogenase family)
MHLWTFIKSRATQDGLANKAIVIMPAYPFAFICPSTRGLSLALTRQLLRSTNLPVYATYRSGSPQAIARDILSSLKDVDESRLNLIPLDLMQEDSIATAARQLSDSLPRDQESYLHTAFMTGGMLRAEKHPADLDASILQETFQINVISHLLLIKHFAHFLPKAHSAAADEGKLAKWAHITARLGSVTDNEKGGWYSYRASKAALNQVIKTFDKQLQLSNSHAICVGVHPGTVKTDLSKPFWNSITKGNLFEPDFAAERIIETIEKLELGARGKVWDWSGKEVPP